MTTSLEIEQDREPSANRVGWNMLPEEMRQFLRNLASMPDGAVIEDGGRPLFRVLPYPRPSSGVEGLEWTSQDNQRRCDLIDKDLDGRLTPNERIELTTLEGRLDKHIDAITPLPLEPLRLLHQKLLDKASVANGTSRV